MSMPLAGQSGDCTISAEAHPRLFGIASQRLELRMLCARDARLYRDLYTDPETMRFIGPTLTRRQAARSFKAALRISNPPLNGPMYLAIIERTSQLSLGLCAIQQIVMRRAETGVIVTAAARGCGIATESLQAVIGWGLAHLPLEHIWVRCSVHNSIAERLVRALGLVRQPLLTTLEHSEIIWSVDHKSWQLKQEKNDVQRPRIS